MIRIVALVVFGLTCLMPKWAWAETYVVAVGNNSGHRHEAPLRFAERDASIFAGVMTQLGDVRPENAAVVLGRKARRIQRTIEVFNRRISRLPARARRASTLVVFYSGHADARGLHPGKSTLSYDELKTAVSTSPAGVKLIIIDGCRSGALTRVKGVKRGKTFDINAMSELRSSGFAMITSSAAGEDSHESERLRAAFFSHHLTNAIRGIGDYNGDGRVTLSEAYSYTYHQTLRSSGTTASLQHPTFDNRLRGRADVALTEPGRFGRHVGFLVLHRPGTYLVVSARRSGPVVAKLQATKSGQRISLPPGPYLVQERREDTYHEYVVRIGTRSEIDLANVSSRTVAYARLVRKGGPVATSNTLTALIGARGPILDGTSPGLQFGLGYSLDLPWLTLGLRGRFTTASDTSDSGLANVTRRELGLGLTVERYVDFELLSLSFGLLTELTYLQQHIDAFVEEPDRHAVGGAFGGLVAIERELIPEASLRIEGGPITFILNRAQTIQGVQTSSTIDTPLTWWIAGGTAWRF